MPSLLASVRGALALRTLASCLRIVGADVCIVCSCPRYVCASASHIGTYMPPKGGIRKLSAKRPQTESQTRTQIHTADSQRKTISHFSLSKNRAFSVNENDPAKSSNPSNLPPLTPTPLRAPLPQTMKKCDKHGLHTNWRFQKSNGRWMCRLCIQAARKEKRISINYARLKEECGEDVACMYLEDVRNGRAHINEYRAIARKNGKHIRGSRGDRARRDRTVILNSIQEQSKNGWHCEKCFLVNESPSFFEIDRIIGGKFGGKYEIGNMRILCPNCHKCKTHLLPHWK